MVSFKVDADARVKGFDGESNPIVAKVKGTGKDGALGVQVTGDGNAPLATKVSIDGPIGIQIPELGGLVDVLARLAEGIKVNLADEKIPVAVSIAQIPVDLTVSVYSPTQDQVFKVEIKGSLGK
ncbi:MAG: hypothetical protein GKC10_07295 [Methanosarcinales archaeon]|nr:hypothetical protein [Methanosarcinales archaeon]